MPTIVAKQRRKVVVAGPVVEIWDYTIGVPMGVKKGGRTVEESKEKERHRRDSLLSAKRQARAKINANHHPGETLMITLTHAANEQDYEVSQACLRRWVRWLRGVMLERYNKLVTWTALPELQDRGAWHWHVLVSVLGEQGLYLANEEVEAAWGQGFTKVRALRGKTDNVGAYVTKYVTKALGVDKHVRGRHAYLSSLHQVMPEVITGPTQAFLVEACEATARQTMGYEYANEHQGVVRFRQYNLGPALPAKNPAASE